MLSRRGRVRAPRHLCLSSPRRVGSPSWRVTICLAALCVRSLRSQKWNGRARVHFSQSFSGASRATCSVLSSSSASLLRRVRARMPIAPRLIISSTHWQACFSSNGERYGCRCRCCSSWPKRSQYRPGKISQRTAPRSLRTRRMPSPRKHHGSESSCAPSV